MTPYPELDAVLAELLRRVRAVLGENLLAAYLQGSFAVGDPDEHSDVDFTMVIRDELTSAQVEALQLVHGEVYQQQSYWAQHLEGSYFPFALLSDPARCGEPLWFLDNGSRALVRSEHCNTLVVRWVLHEKAISMYGPPAASLVPAVPANDLRREIRAVMREWGAEILAQPEKYHNHFYQTFIVLSYCRMLHSLVEGGVFSKRRGAAWAKSNLDPAWSDLIDRTWAGRPVPEVSVRRPADPGDMRRTLEFIQYAIRMAHTPPPPSD